MNLRFKGYFKNKIKTAKYNIWETEFKIFLAQLEREEIRIDYDNNKAKLELVLAKMNSDEGKKLKETNIDEFRRLEDEVERLDGNKKTGVPGLIQKGEDKLKEIDVLIHGTKPNNDYPEGALGYKGQIEKYKDLIDTVKNYVKNYDA